MIRFRSRPLLAGAALSVLALLGACAEQTATAPATTAAQPQAAPGPGAPTQLSLGSCAEAPGDAMHFTIGQSQLRVPQSAIRNISPTASPAGASSAEITQRITALLGDGQGCPEKPMPANLVVIQNAVTNPLLAGPIAILRRPAPEAITRFTELTRRLQTQRPEGNCRPASADLLACFGTETTPAGSSQVMYLVTTDTRQTLSTGGPLSARCILRDQQVVRCGMLDVLRNGLAVDATLKGGQYSTASLRAARDAAIEQVARYQL